MCTILNDDEYKEGNNVYSFEIMKMSRDEMNDRLQTCNLRNWVIDRSYNLTLGKWDVFINTMNSLTLSATGF